MSEYVQGVGPTSWHQHDFKIASSQKIWVVIWRNSWQLLPRLCTGDSLIKVVTPNDKPSRIEDNRGSLLMSWVYLMTCDSHQSHHSGKKCQPVPRWEPSWAWAIWECPRDWVQQLHRCMMVYVYSLYIYYIIYYMYTVYTYHICVCVCVLLCDASLNAIECHTHT